MDLYKKPIKELSVSYVHNDSYLVNRALLLKEIHKGLFSELKTVVLLGPEGIGKTSLAFSYLKQFVLTTDNQSIIIWINASTKKLVQQVYFTRLAEFFVFKRKHFSNDNDLYRVIQTYLRQLNINVYFILDNVKDYNNILDHFHEIDPNLIKTIVTTSLNKSIEHDTYKRFKHINLSGFSDQEAFDYLAKRSDAKMTAEDAQEMFDYFSNNNQSVVFPICLKLAYSLLLENKNWRLNNSNAQIYVAEAVKSLAETINRDSLTFKILASISYLNDQFIEKDLVSHIASKQANDNDANHLNESLNELNKKGLIDFVNKNDQPGVKIHEQIQIVLRQLLNQNDLNEQLIKTFNDQLEPVNVDEYILDKDWSKMNLLLPHYLSLFNSLNSKSIETTKAIMNLASYYKIKFNDVNRSIELYMSCVEFFKENNADNFKNEIAICQFDIGTGYEQLNEINLALKNYESSYELRNSLFGNKSHPYIANSLNNIGNAHDLLNNPKKALEFHTKALDMRKLLYPSGIQKSIAISYNNIGLAHKTMNDYEKMREYFEKSFEVFKSLYKDGIHGDIACNLSNQGMAQCLLGNFKKSLDLYLQSYDLRKTIYPYHHPEIASILSYIASAYETLGDIERAIKCYSEAYDIRKFLHTGYHQDLAYSLNNIGFLYLKFGNYTEALNCFEEAYSMRKLMFINDHVEKADSLKNLGLVYMLQTRYGKALESYKDELKIRKTLNPSDSIELYEALMNIAKAYSSLGENQKAQDFFSQAHLMHQRLGLGIKEEKKESPSNQPSQPPQPIELNQPPQQPAQPSAQSPKPVQPIQPVQTNQPPNPVTTTSNDNDRKEQIKS